MTKQAQGQTTPTVEALRDIARHGPTIAGSYVHVYRQQIAEMQNIARTALPAAEREAEVKAMLVEALEEAQDELHANSMYLSGEPYNNPKITAALKATTGGAE